MTKLKLGEKIVSCKVCKREQTINMCEIHTSSTEKCFYCHLLKDHITEYKAEPEVEDKTPTKIVGKKGNINDIFKDDNKISDKELDSIKGKNSDKKKGLDKLRDDTNKAIDESKDKPKDTKESKNEFGFSRDEDDDRGLYS